jgi:hypothetical protein
MPYFIYPFAVSGDKSPIPETVQPDGSISYQAGYPVNYTYTYGVTPGAQAVARLTFNELMYDITSEIQKYQQFGVPAFITTADNGGTPFPYSQYAIVRYDPGSGPQLYMSLVNSNTALPTVSANWAAITSSTNSALVSNNSISQTIPTGISLLNFAFNSGNGDYDPLGIWTGTRFIPTRPGVYNVGGVASLNLTMSSATVPTFDILVYKSGNYYKTIGTGSLFSYFAGSLIINPSAGSCPVELNGTTDYLQLYINNMTGVTCTTTTQPGENYFWLAYEGPL